MHFCINLPYSSRSFNKLTIRMAKTCLPIKIASYKMRADDILLDSYLKRYYDIGLRKAAFKVLSNCVYTDMGDHLSALLRDDSLKEIARLIAHGCLGIRGSDILRYAMVA